MPGTVRFEVLPGPSEMSVPDRRRPPIRKRLESPHPPGQVRSVGTSARPKAFVDFRTTYIDVLRVSSNTLEYA